jgi:hypothetical protein
MRPSDLTPRALVPRAVLAWLLLAAAPASAEWTRVTDLPVTNVFSLFSNGDTLAAGVDTAVYLSTNGGAGFAPRPSPPRP